MTIENPSWGIHCRVGREIPVNVAPEHERPIFLALLEPHEHCAMSGCNCDCHTERRVRFA